MTHRPARLLAVDVGGTNTRVVICEADGGERVVECRAVLDTKDELRDLVETTAREAGGWDAIGHTVIDFAGPVRRPDVAQMTNWPGSPEIFAEDLSAWFGHSRRFTMLNDMEAAALGVISAPADASETLHAGVPVPDGARLIVAPGTGLGSIGVVSGTALKAEVLRGLLPSEVGHARAAPGSGQLTEALFAWLDDHGYWPGWEELVSGRGLEGLYAIVAGQVADAAWIASHGDREQAGYDDDAVTALELFYEALAIATQTLALAYMPTAGIWLTGASTKNNLNVLRRSPAFIEHLHDNVPQGELLRRFPVYALATDRNLEGCLWLAAQMRAEP